MIISLLNRQTFDEPLDLLKLFLLLTFFVWFVFCFCFLCLFFVFWESGTLDKNEIKETLKNLHLGVSDHDIMHWMRSLDDDGSGAVDPPEFLEKVLGRPATEAELKEIKGGPGVDSSGKKITHNLAIGKGGGLKKQNEAVTKQILASLETTYKRSVFGHFVTDAKTLFHAIDRDTSGAVDKEELAKGLRRLGIHCNVKQMSQWVDSLQLNDDGEITKQTFVSTLNRANQLTRHIHELCHAGERSMFGILIVDAASFFFAVDQDKSVQRIFLFFFLFDLLRFFIFFFFVGGEGGTIFF